MEINHQIIHSKDNKKVGEPLCKVILDGVNQIIVGVNPLQTQIQDGGQIIMDGVSQFKEVGGNNHSLLKVGYKIDLLKLTQIGLITTMDGEILSSQIIKVGGETIIITMVGEIHNNKTIMDGIMHKVRTMINGHLSLKIRIVVVIIIIMDGVTLLLRVLSLT